METACCGESGNDSNKTGRNLQEETISADCPFSYSDYQQIQRRFISRSPALGRHLSVGVCLSSAVSNFNVRERLPTAIAV